MTWSGRIIAKSCSCRRDALARQIHRIADSAKAGADCMIVSGGSNSSPND
jgi:hypothetical protein